jgi:hypothetical protein
MGLYEILYPYFDRLQFWHLVVGGFAIYMTAGWQLQKKKLDRENADLIAYDKAVKEMKLKEKQDRKKGRKP